MKINMIAYFKMRCNPAEYYDNRVLDLNLNRTAIEERTSALNEKISETDFIKEWRKLHNKINCLMKKLELCKIRIRRAKRLKAEE